MFGKGARVFSILAVLVVLTQFSLYYCLAIAKLIKALEFKKIEEKKIQRA